jgi:hypothetical protein
VSLCETPMVVYGRRKNEHSVRFAYITATACLKEMDRVVG